MLQLKNALMGLAAPAEVQDWLYPDFTCKGDELVIDYSEALRESAIKCTLTSKQLVTLNKLESFLDTHSGKEYEEMYTETTSLYSDPRWEEIREYARSFISEMGWVYEHPQRNGATYVNSTGSSENT